MIRKLLVLATLGAMLSGCYMVPMALIGPTTAGFTSASLVQSGISTTANYMVKKSTGKTISQHAFDVLDKELLQNSYFPENATTNRTLSKSELSLILRN